MAGFTRSCMLQQISRDSCRLILQTITPNLKALLSDLIPMLLISAQKRAITVGSSNKNRTIIIIFIIHGIYRSSSKTPCCSYYVLSFCSVLIGRHGTFELGTRRDRRFPCKMRATIVPSATSEAPNFRRSHCEQR